ncbi:hypothetical protein CFO_g4856 [Ceratocystis platani]|uniref:Uncharacterized protein n=1 Tax=Ceratocystis fimbriata f. sp. platani TaxID=88771 RepID=A0A0F8AXF9_CERFI|nr:hypothetical protein CFO_g4856 [Ceratocystis platani]
MQFWTASVLLAFAANAVMAAPSPVVDMDDMDDMGENPGYYNCSWYYNTGILLRKERLIVEELQSKNNRDAYYLKLSVN